MIGHNLPIITAGALAAGCALFAATAPVAPWDWATLLKDYGPWVLLVGFFVWHFTSTTTKREDRLASRITNLETFVQEKLVELVDKSSVAIADNTAALNALIQALSDRPCQFNGGDVVERLQTIADKLEKGKP